MNNVWVLTAAPRKRLDEVSYALDYTKIPSNRQVIVTTQPEPISEDDIDGHVLLFDSEEINISKWWTLGLDFIESAETNPTWDVLWLSSDVLIEPETIDTVRRVMRDEGCDMAGPDWHRALDNKHLVSRSTQRHSLHTRIPGVSFVLRGESGTRPDPEFRWWLADDDFEWQNKSNGGTVLVAGTHLNHLTDGHPLDEPRLAAFKEDIIKFKNKWGDDPFHGSPPL